MAEDIRRIVQHLHSLAMPEMGAAFMSQLRDASNRAIGAIFVRQPTVSLWQSLREILVDHRSASPGSQVGEPIPPRRCDRPGCVVPTSKGCSVCEKVVYCSMDCSRL